MWITAKELLLVRMDAETDNTGYCNIVDNAIKYTGSSDIYN